MGKQNPRRHPVANNHYSDRTDRELRYETPAYRWPRTAASRHALCAPVPVLADSSHSTPSNLQTSAPFSILRLVSLFGRPCPRSTTAAQRRDSGPERLALFGALHLVATASLCILLR